VYVLVSVVAVMATNSWLQTLP